MVATRRAQDFERAAGRSSGIITVGFRGLGFRVQGSGFRGLGLGMFEGLGFSANS